MKPAPGVLDPEYALKLMSNTNNMPGNGMLDSARRWTGSGGGESYADMLKRINRFVFGGGLTNFGDVLFDRVKAEFDRYNHIPLPVEFKIAELGSDIGLIGAAEFVREA